MDGFEKWNIICSFMLIGNGIVENFDLHQSNAVFHRSLAYHHHHLHSYHCCDQQQQQRPLTYRKRWPYQARLRQRPASWHPHPSLPHHHHSHHHCLRLSCPPTETEPRPPAPPHFPGAQQRTPTYVPSEGGGDQRSQSGGSTASQCCGSCRSGLLLFSVFVCERLQFLYSH